jgi:hypothetical protein
MSQHVIFSKGRPTFPALDSADGNGRKEHACQNRMNLTMTQLGERRAVA